MHHCIGLIAVCAYLNAGKGSGIVNCNGSVESGSDHACEKTRNEVNIHVPTFGFIILIFDAFCSYDCRQMVYV